MNTPPQTSEVLQVFGVPWQFTLFGGKCGYSSAYGKSARLQIEERGYIPHTRPRGEELEEQQKSPDFKARRWVVDVCHSWFNRFRKLLVRYEKNGSQLSGVSNVSRFGYRFMKNKTAKSGQYYLWISSKYQLWKDPLYASSIRYCYLLLEWLAFSILSSIIQASVYLAAMYLQDESNCFVVF